MNASRAEVLSDRLGAMQSAVAQNSERVSVLNKELEGLTEGRKDWLQEVHRVGESQKAVAAQSRVAKEQLAEAADGERGRGLHPSVVSRKPARLPIFSGRSRGGRRG